ncbi:hypothetical protein SEA_NICOLE72_3 [Microbacterium phage Nicole72]|uniref:Uncharacterized protein n=1 Tax=Microbacterium phage Nicole72 TaxID=3062838 RepID=A0ACD4UKY9_9CAUD|nr:hypothetical protein SEA_NICOLE72_3 [Microbacterium phage Nicole72]
MVRREPETGWLSDIDPEVTNPDGSPMWQPVLQTRSICLSPEVWFATEAECDAFIRDECIGQTWHPREGKS